MTSDFFKNTGSEDLVEIEGLRVETLIGVEAWERKKPLALVLDLQVQTDFSRAAERDSVEDAVDYAVLCAEITELGKKSEQKLLESFGEKVCALVLSHPRVQTVRLRLRKCGFLPGTDAVGIRMFRATRGVQNEKANGR